MDYLTGKMDDIKLHVFLMAPGGEEDIRQQCFLRSL